MPRPRHHYASILDALSRAVPDLDTLIRDVELGRPGRPLDLHDFEERAQRLASAIVAPFRRPTASRPPLSIERRPDGSARAGW